MTERILSHETLLKLKRWNTPTIFNGWEQITKRDRTQGCFNLEETRDFMPQMGPAIGYAVTVVIEPSNPNHPQNNPNCWAEYREYVAGIPGPKIVVVQDLDKPNFVGAFWGEVNSNTHKALGCAATITDGAVRDVDEMTNAGFKAVAKRLCVGHAYSVPVRWNCEVEVFGCKVQPGRLIHADKHGFLVIPDEDLPDLYDAVCFMDANECETTIKAARESAGKPIQEITPTLNSAGEKFQQAVRERFGERGE